MQSSHTRTSPRRLSSRNISQRQILGFVQILAPLGDRCRPHLRTSQTEAVTPAIQINIKLCLVSTMPTRLHSPLRLSGREDFPPSGKSCDQHQTGVYGRTFSVPVATCLKNVIYQIRVSSDKIFLPVPNTHNTHSVSLDVWSFVIRQEANCNNLIPLRVRLQHCQVLIEPNS